MNLKTLFVAGIMAMAVVAGVIEALCSPHSREGSEVKEGGTEEQPL